MSSTSICNYWSLLINFELWFHDFKFVRVQTLIWLCRMTKYRSEFLAVSARCTPTFLQNTRFCSDLWLIWLSFTERFKQKNIFTYLLCSQICGHFVSLNIDNNLHNENILSSCHVPITVFISILINDLDLDCSIIFAKCTWTPA